MEQKVIEAISIVAKALEEDPGYFDIWRKNIATAFAVELTQALEKGVEPNNENLFKISYIAAGAFLDSLVYGAKTEHGWVYRKSPF